ncbi:MAG: polysaccharide deacetylase family protein [Actinobacteria bacterium]|nr:polysaccharide deacetylase family protein [Actinomycetota bacterium]
MSRRLGSLLYAALLVVALGAGCALPRAVPTSVLAPAPYASTATAAVSSVSSSASPTPTVSPPMTTSISPDVRTTTAPTTTGPGTTTRQATTTGAATNPGTCAISSTLLGKELTEVPGGAKVVALTFDAGANARGVPSILATLAGRRAPGTFFLTGAFVNAFPADSRTIAASYPVGNHTQTHPDLTQLTSAQGLAEIRAGAASIVRVTGTDPRPYFRFPYGAVSSRVISLVNGECYVPFRWTVDTLGWKGTAGGISAAVVVQRVVDTLRPGAIVLMHVGSNPDDGTTFDADALPRLIDEIRARGYTLVTLERVLPASP